ncbi:peptidase family C78-domain-containing protein [Suillus subalutaceus]|uniref:peptidase family C78-domain-containing protein n=1 Tax=Suillus subalutaceus TaxID=48586 RepID=UPI001B85F5F2|nr:peptidase family C78-domain-containing protein [Suillus subalutaceus]KAG1858383.1 peptidase family C78-domain-containing protein [Suillus subalutaceus]
MDSDDEIEIIGESSSRPSCAGPTLCQLCDMNFDSENFSEFQRHQHYEAHFNSSSSKQGPSSDKFRKPAIPKDLFKPCSFQLPLRKKQADEFWYPTLSRPPPDNYCPGLIPLLKHALKKSHTKGNTRRAVLCYESATHICVEAFDRRWGCGYRNFLMACAALMDQQIQSIYFALLDDPFPPSVRNLQRWIEAAWKEGYDREGAKDLRNLVDTDKWIGTAELYTAFTFRGIPSQLVDFDLSKSEKGIQVMIDWIVRYFSPPNPKQDTVTDVLRGASPVVATDKMPLVLQFNGHSQTIVGYEISKNGDTNLLVFDPSRPPRLSMRRAAIAGTSSVVWEQSRTNQVLQSVMHPTSNGRSSKLKRPSSSSDMQQHKRTKSSESDDEIIIVENFDEPKNGRESGVSAGQTQPSTLDPSNVVNHFRLGMSKLKRKQNYQILYFPMTDPWSIEERDKRKVVTSISCC